jgi:hypothetical protein
MGENHVRSTVASLVLVAATIFSAGCASIVHNGPRTVPIASTPPGAKVTIYDRANNIVSVSNTPFVATLPTKYGYFKGQSYRLVFEMPGYAKAETRLVSSVSGWYFGNLVFGGLIGMLIVDPLTGAMYNLAPEKIEQSLTTEQAGIIRNGDGMMVILVSQATENERAAMVRVN